MRPIDADSLKPDMIHEYNTFPAAPQYGTLQRVLGVSMEQIAKAPTIEPKRGEWIYCEDYVGHDGYECSNCGFFVPWAYDVYADSNFILNYHTCPYCSARMKGKDNE